MTQSSGADDASKKPASTSPVNAAEEFRRMAAAGDQSLVAELLDFLRVRRKWWLIPVVGVLLVLMAIIVISGTGAGAFVYTLF